VRALLWYNLFWARAREEDMTHPFSIRLFLPVLLSVTGCMISVTAEAECDQSHCPCDQGPCPLPPLQTAGGGAAISINRGKIQVYCAKGDSTRECADAMSDVITSEGGGSAGVAYATNSIKCGDTIYTVSTNTDTGSCLIGGERGKPPTNVHCTDGGKQVASADCGTGCGDVTNGGSCKISSGK
jgi:hypothetical protein